MLFVVVCLLSPLWFIRNIKYILFWIYLWQLKQYHRRRFIDHFKTEKGKKLLTQPLRILKVLLLIFTLIGYFILGENYFLFLPAFLYTLYFLEILLYFKALFAKRAKNPRITIKTSLLIFVSVFAVILCPLLVWLLTENTFWFVFSLLATDVLLFLIVSLIVIIIQPIADYYRLSLQKRAKEKIKSFKNLTVIGITGSYGKTSTKNYLTKILSSKFKVLNTKEHQNTEISIPKLILKELTPEHDILIIEMGAYDKGTIKKICDFAKPNIGIVTGVNEQHLSLFGSMENLLSAEGGRELAGYLEKKGGFIILNGDNKHCLDLYNSTEAQKKIYGLKDKTDISVSDIKIEKVFSSFIAEIDKEKADFKVEIKGGHNILNLLACILTAKKLGMNLKEISDATHGIMNSDDSIKTLRSSSGLNILDSTYSTNPDGVIADLEYLMVYPAKRVIVMPCLIELGNSVKRIHQSIGAKIAEVCDMAIITAKEYFENIKEGAVANGMDEKNILFIPDASAVVKEINSFCKKGDTVLLEGRIEKSIIEKLIK